MSAIYLNAQSANYYMVSGMMITPIVVLFFTIFPSLNSGLDYPLYISIPCVGLNTASLITWWYWENIVLMAEDPAVLNSLVFYI
jgi:hypothetical protein